MGHGVFNSVKTEVVQLLDVPSTEQSPSTFPSTGQVSEPASSSAGDGSPQGGWSITEKITTSMLKVQENLHSSMEKTRRHSEHVQHPWPCKSRDLLTQPNQEP